jgi:hypothetical protein
VPVSPVVAIQPPRAATAAARNFCSPQAPSELLPRRAPFASIKTSCNAPDQPKCTRPGRAGSPPHADRAYGRGTGVGRGLGVGDDLGVGVGLGVDVGVGVGVAVAVGVGVGVGLGVEVVASMNCDWLGMPLVKRVASA